MGIWEPCEWETEARAERLRRRSLRSCRNKIPTAASSACKPVPPSGRRAAASARAALTEAGRGRGLRVASEGCLRLSVQRPSRLSRATSSCASSSSSPAPPASSSSSSSQRLQSAHSPAGSVMATRSPSVVVSVAWLVSPPGAWPTRPAVGQRWRRLGPGGGGARGARWGQGGSGGRRWGSGELTGFSVGF